MTDVVVESVKQATDVQYRRNAELVAALTKVEAALATAERVIESWAKQCVANGKERDAAERALAESRAETDRVHERAKAERAEAVVAIQAAERERAEAKGRAERAERSVESMTAENALLFEQNGIVSAEVEQLRAKLTDWMARAAHVTERVAEARRQGWADGAKAMRAACAERVRGEGHSLADELDYLPLPPCPDEPPTGTGDAVREFAEENARVQEAASKGGLRDTGTATVASGEADTCAGCLALLDRAAEMLSEVQEEPDGWQEWVADREKHMHAQADAIKAAVGAANNRAADAFLRWDNGDVNETPEEFSEWLRSGEPAPGTVNP